MTTCTAVYGRKYSDGALNHAQHFLPSTFTILNIWQAEREGASVTCVNNNVNRALYVTDLICIFPVLKTYSPTEKSKVLGVFRQAFTVLLAFLFV